MKAQISKDALYLKNGSVIYGKLIEIDSDHYKIQMSDGSQMIYSQSDVDKFSKTTILPAGRKKSGPGFALEAGFLVGAQSSDYKAPFSFNFLANYTIDTRNIISAGTGVEFIEVPFSPLILEYKHLFTENVVTPYFFGRIGKMMHLGPDDESEYTNTGYYEKFGYKGGFTTGAGIGISWSKENIEPYLSFAYRYIATSFKQRDYNNSYPVYKNCFNRLEVKLGFKF